MRARRQDDGGSLLMLSHVLPQADGSSQRARAWQLLSLASRTHQVRLACLIDGPAHLSHWRAIQHLTPGCVLEAPPLGTSLDPERAARRHGRVMKTAIGPWLTQTRFDAVLCTSPLLWDATEQVDARIRLCDLALPASVTHRRLAREGSSLRRWWHQRQFHAHDRIERQVARQCDLLLLTHEEHARRYALEPSRKVAFSPQDPATAWALLEALQGTRPRSLAKAA